MTEGRELHEMGETGTRWVEHGMPKSKQSPVSGSPPYRTKAGTDVGSNAVASLWPCSTSIRTG